MFEFPKEFLLKYKTEYNVSHFIPIDSKRNYSTNWSWTWVVYHIVKIKQILSAEENKYSKNKNDTKFNFEGQSARSKEYFVLEEKLIKN